MLVMRDVHLGLICIGKLTLSRAFCPQAACIAPILRKLSANHTSLNSACAFFNPRMLNSRIPKTLLIQPLGGSGLNRLGQTPVCLVLAALQKSYSQR